MCAIHALFHIEFTLLVLRSMNREFSAIDTDFSIKPQTKYIHQLANYLRMLKMVYYKSWRMTSLINRRFGTQLIIILFHAMCLTGLSACLMFSAVVNGRLEDLTQMSKKQQLL